MNNVGRFHSLLHKPLFINPPKAASHIFFILLIAAEHKVRGAMLDRPRNKKKNMSSPAAVSGVRP